MRLATGYFYVLSDTVYSYGSQMYRFNTRKIIYLLIVLLVAFAIWWLEG